MNCTGRATWPADASHRSRQSACAERHRVPFPVASWERRRRWVAMSGARRLVVGHCAFQCLEHPRRPLWRATWTTTSTFCEICARLIACSETRSTATCPSTPEFIPLSVTVCYARCKMIRTIALIPWN